MNLIVIMSTEYTCIGVQLWHLWQPKEQPVSHYRNHVCWKKKKKKKYIYIHNYMATSFNDDLKNDRMACKSLSGAKNTNLDQLNKIIWHNVITINFKDDLKNEIKKSHFTNDLILLVNEI